MRQILSETTLRKLQLIEHLDLLTNPIEEEQLAAVLAISKRTLKNDIQQINNEYDFLHIYKTHQGIYLAYAEGKNYRAIYSYLLKHELGFRLLDYIFRESNVTLEQVAKELYTSPSTIYRLVNKLNQALEFYHIKICYPSLTFDGEEVDIRFFFAQFYSELADYDEWPFDDIDITVLKELVIFAYDLVCDKLNYSTLLFLLFSISVNLIRLRQNHRIFIESNAVDIVYQEFLKLPQQAERMQEIAQQLGFELNLNNIKQLFVAYTKEALSSPVKEEMINETAEEVVRQSTAYLARIIHHLSEKYRVPIEDAVGLAGYLHNTVNLFKWETETFNILYPYIPNFIERAQYYIGDFVTDARQLVHEYIEAMELDSSEVMHNVLVYELITHWPHLIKYLFTDQIRHIHCAVISDNAIDHAAFMVDVLNINKRPYVHYHVYTGQDIDPLTLDSSDYDVIITTFPIPPLQYKPVCSIHRFPTEKDFQLIDQTIYGLVNIK